MKRTLLALTAAAVVGFAAPASAMSFQVSFPTLTYPPQPAPDATQGCSDLTTIKGDTCSAPAK